MTPFETAATNLVFAVQQTLELMTPEQAGLLAEQSNHVLEAMGMGHCKLSATEIDKQKYRAAYRQPNVPECDGDRVKAVRSAIEMRNSDFHAAVSAPLPAVPASGNVIAWPVVARRNHLRVMQ